MSRLPLGLLMLCCALLRGQSMVGIDGWMEREMARWRVPGVALGIVRGDEVVHRGIYGRSVGPAGAEIGEGTLFGIGSITKSMTATILLSLVEEGRLDLDRPVRDYAPDFRLSDPIITAQATVRDLLTHRTGLPRHDALWFRSPWTRAELFERLRYLDFSAGLRERYQYNNLMYMAAGVVAERVSGKRWEELVRERVFRPTGMTSSNTSVNEPGAYAIERKTALDSIGPAGSVNATLNDFLRYLRVQMNGGAVEGKRVLSEKAWRQMLQPQTTIHGAVYEEFGEQSYGLGLFLGQYAGRKVAFHTGTIGGYHSLLAFLPEERMGVVVLMNRTERYLPKVISATVFDRLLGRPERDWSGHFDALRKKQEAARKPVAAVTGTPAVFQADELAGTYRHPAYGAIEVNGKQEISWGWVKGPLKHLHHDVYRLDLGREEVGETRIQFRRGMDGAVEELRIPLEAALPPVEFRREAVRR